MPNQALVEACGSRSITSTRRPFSPRVAARLTVVVVLPLPPFWLMIESERIIRLPGTASLALPTWQ